MNTGAIDPLSDIAEVCREEDVWLHVDGAYGAPAVLSAKYAAELEAVCLADSVALDPHKWMCVPVEAGLVLIRHADAQRSAFSLVPPYLRTDGSQAGVGGPPWFSEYGFQQTRGFRALKVWMSLRCHGWRATATSSIERSSWQDIWPTCSARRTTSTCEPQSLGIVCFRLNRRGVGARDQNIFNQTALARLQLGGIAFLSSTVLNGVFWLRACILNPRTTSADLAAMVEAVRRAGAELSEIRRIDNISCQY